MTDKEKSKDKKTVSQQEIDKLEEIKRIIDGDRKNKPLGYKYKLFGRWVIMTKEIIKR